MSGTIQIWTVSGVHVTFGFRVHAFGSLRAAEQFMDCQKPDYKWFNLQSHDVVQPREGC